MSANSGFSIIGDSNVDGMSAFLEQLRNGNGWERVDVHGDGNCMLHSVIGAANHNSVLKKGLMQLVGRCDRETMANRLRERLGNFYIELSELPKGGPISSPMVQIRQTLTELGTDWVKKIPRKSKRTYDVMSAIFKMVGAEKRIIERRQWLNSADIRILAFLLHKFSKCTVNFVVIHEFQNITIAKHNFHRPPLPGERYASIYAGPSYKTTKEYIKRMTSANACILYYNGVNHYNYMTRVTPPRPSRCNVSCRVFRCQGITRQKQPCCRCTYNPNGYCWAHTPKSNATR